MIKFVACDLDGTLLPPTKVLPEETFDLIQKFHARGGVFAPASGRQLPNLLKLFAPVKDKIAVIAENGGIAWYNGKTVFRDPTPAESVKYALDIIRGEERLYPVLSCEDCAYYEKDDEAFITTLNRSYSAAEKVENLDGVIGKKDIIKISVWDPLVAAEHGGVVLPQKIKGLRTMVSGYDWLDVCVEGANKGKAMLALLESLKIDRAESAAFGDHMNDLEMLEASGKAFVTANAYPPLKARIGEVIESNAEFGVIKKLKELI